MKHFLFAEIYVNNSKQPIFGENYRIVPHEDEYTKKDKKFTVHAEEDALNKFLRGCSHLSPAKIRRLRLSIVVIRYDKNGQLVNARPCCKCMKLLEKYRIKKIVYSNNSKMEKII